MAFSIIPGKPPKPVPHEPKSISMAPRFVEPRMYRFSPNDMYRDILLPGKLGHSARGASINNRKRVKSFQVQIGER